MKKILLRDMKLLEFETQELKNQTRINILLPFSHHHDDVRRHKTKFQFNNSMKLQEENHQLQLPT